MRPNLLNPLFTPVSSLEGVGPKIEKAMTRLLRGSEQATPAILRDLIFHLPHSVIDRRRQPGIARSPEGVIVTLKVRVDRHQVPPKGNRRVPYRVHVHDETGEMALVFFHGHTDYLAKALPVGETRYVSGRVEWFNGQPNMVHPDHIVDEAGFADLPLVEPVYPNTGGLAQKTPVFAFDFQMSAELKKRLDDVNAAITERQVLKIAYETAGGDGSAREIEPLSLQFWGKVWTLAAWCRLRQDFRTFRLDRITQMSLTGETVRPVRGRTLRDFLEKMSREACIETPPGRI